MNICSLRAKTLDDKFYTFTVADIPVVVGENTFVLLKRKFSPIMQLNTISIGSDVGIYAGDIIKDENGALWYVCYESGFVAYDNDKSKRKLLYEFDKMEVVGQMTPEEKSKMHFKKMKFKFKFQEYIFTLMDIVGKYYDDLLTCNISGRVAASEIQQDMAVSLDGKRIYLGDLYRGLTVIMCYGRICVQNEFGVYDILESCYITNMRGE